MLQELWSHGHNCTVWIKNYGGCPCLPRPEKLQAFCRWDNSNVSTLLGSFCVPVLGINAMGQAKHGTLGRLKKTHNLIIQKGDIIGIYIYNEYIWILYVTFQWYNKTWLGNALNGYLHRKIIQLLGDFAVPYVPEDMFAGLQPPCHYITSSIHLP